MSEKFSEQKKLKVFARNNEQNTDINWLQGFFCIYLNFSSFENGEHMQRPSHPNNYKWSGRTIHCCHSKIFCVRINKNINYTDLKYFFIVVAFLA